MKRNIVMTKSNKKMVVHLCKEFLSTFLLYVAIINNSAAASRVTTRICSCVATELFGGQQTSLQVNCVVLNVHLIFKAF